MNRRGCSDSTRRTTSPSSPSRMTRLTDSPVAAASRSSSGVASSNPRVRSAARPSRKAAGPNRYLSVWAFCTTYPAATNARRIRCAVLACRSSARASSMTPTSLPASRNTPSTDNARAIVCVPATCSFRGGSGAPKPAVLTPVPFPTWSTQSSKSGRHPSGATPLCHRRNSEVLQSLFHLAGDVDHDSSRLGQRVDLGLTTAATAGDDGSCVTHAPVWRSATPGNERHHGFVYAGDQLSGVLFHRPADLAHHHYRVCAGIGFEGADRVRGGGAQ